MPVERSGPVGRGDPSTPNPLARLERFLADCEAAYDAATMDTWRGVIETAVSGVESDTEQPLYTRLATAIAYVTDAARQYQEMGLPLLSGTTTAVAEHLASLWRMELAVASSPAPDEPPSIL